MKLRKAHLQNPQSLIKGNSKSTLLVDIWHSKHLAVVFGKQTKKIIHSMYIQATMGVHHFVGPERFIIRYTFKTTDEILIF